MKTSDIFNRPSSKKLNESLIKAFGKRINFEQFDLDQLQDARNKLRTQVSQIRGQSGFNENLENDAFHQAQWMLDAINAEIAERDEHIIEAEADDLVMRVEDFLAGWMEAANDHEEYEVHGELIDLADNFDKHRDIHKLRDEIKGLTPLGEFYKSLLMFLNKEFKKDLAKSEGFDGDLEEGQTDVDYELHQIAASDDEEELIDAMEGLKGVELQNALEDMMSDLKDELASKGMNDVMRDDDKMIELLMDKVIEEYGEDGEEYDYGPMDSSDDADALKSAGFGNDEDYESIHNEDHGPENPDAEYNRGEYDREGDMAKDQLRTVNDAAKELYSIIHADENLPEWVQSKITKAMDYLDTARDYMKSNKYAENKEIRDNLVAEGEVQQASAIVTAKTMVDRVGRWIEELSGMENETLLQLGDAIRDEMGQEQSKAFIEAVAPAIQQALETLKGTRETLSTGVNQLATGEQPADMLGAEPMEPSGEEEVGAVEPDAMNAEEPAGDEFAAAEPATGGPEDAGREQRESIDYQNRLLKVLAG